MGEKKHTHMDIKVNLGCEKCRRKIKKILCDIPQVQNQEYDEKTNTVVITVYCCCPEKIREKIRCKGGKTVKAIDIKPSEKPKSPRFDPQPPGHPNVCSRGCYERYCWCYCYENYGRPVLCYEGCGRPVYDSWVGGYGRVCYVSRCEYYLSEENPRGCTIL